MKYISYTLGTLLVLLSISSAIFFRNHSNNTDPAGIFISALLLILSIVLAVVGYWKPSVALVALMTLLFVCEGLWFLLIFFSPGI